MTSKLTDAQLGRVVRGLVAKAESCEVVQIYRYNARIQADESVREYEVSLNGSSLHEGDTLDEAFLAAASAAGVDVGEPDAAEAEVARLREALAELCDLMDDVRSGLYTPDWFTTQSARKALAALPADMAGLVAVPREALYCALQGHVGDCPSLLGAACECGVEAAEDTLRAALGEP